MLPLSPWPQILKDCGIPFIFMTGDDLETIREVMSALWAKAVMGGATPNFRV